MATDDRSEKTRSLNSLAPKSPTLWWSATAVAFVGVLLSLYSIKHHNDYRANGHTEAFCNISSDVSCDAVAASKYSEIAGVPLGVLGAGYFLAMLILSATVARGHKTRSDHEPAWFVLVGFGIVSSLVLGWISIGVIGKLCVVCLATYACTLAQAAIAFLLLKDGDQRDFSFKKTTNGLVTSILTVALSIVAFNFLKPASELPPELQDVAGKHDNLRPPGSQIPAKEIPVNRTQYSGAGEDYRLGRDDAKVTLVEFADYQCPACADAKTVIDELHKVMGDRVLIVFKNYPLSNQCNRQMQSNMHQYSCDIARLARCAGQSGKFWEFHRKAFDDQKNASLEQAKIWGKGVGMSDSQMDACLKSDEILAKIQDDVDLGDRVGVDGTPTIFINGQKYTGRRTVQDLRAVIDPLL
jgi:protein-disulfide isomerase/uncharacterized membrane protein